MISPFECDIVPRWVRKPCRLNACHAEGSSTEGESPAYMAPEMFAGEPGNEATDIYALGVTMFRAFTGEFPYGNPDATSPPRRDRPRLFFDRPRLFSDSKGCGGRV